MMMRRNSISAGKDVFKCSILGKSMNYSENLTLVWNESSYSAVRSQMIKLK